MQINLPLTGGETEVKSSLRDKASRTEECTGSALVHLEKAWPGVTKMLGFHRAATMDTGEGQGSVHCQLSLGTSFRLCLPYSMPVMHSAGHQQTLAWMRCCPLHLTEQTTHRNDVGFLVVRVCRAGQGEQRL